MAAVMTLSSSPRSNRRLAPDEFWLIAAALAVPALAIFQPLLPSAVENSVLYLRLIGAPVLVAVLLRRSLYVPALALLAALILLTGYRGLTEQPRDFALVNVSLFGSLIAFRLGAFAASTLRDLSRIWRSLIIGVSLVNAATLLIYALALQGVIDLEVLLTLTQKEVDLGLSRFSLGNAIEVPFIVTALLYAGIRCGPANRTHLVAATLNMATAVVSESRIVFVIAALILLRELARGSWRTLLVLAVVLVIGGVLVGDAGSELVSPIADSLSARFAGEDYGSGDDRAWLVGFVLSSIEPLQLLFGGGVTAGARLLLETTGQYRTVESALLQALFEVGVIGIGLMLAAMLFDARGRMTRLNRPSLALALLWIQALFFLPVTHLLPLAAFAIGALTAAPHGNAGPRVRRPAAVEPALSSAPTAP